MMAESMKQLCKLKILCWNRAGNTNKDKKSRTQNQATFWDAVGDPAIIFLQEEVHMIGTQGTPDKKEDYSLSSTHATNYEELFVEESTQSRLCNAIAYKTDRIAIQQNINIKTFLYHVLAEAESSKTTEFAKSIDYLKQLFQHLQASGIDEVVENHSSYLKNGHEYGTFAEYLEGERIINIINDGGTVTITQIVDMHNRVCIVPLNISGQLILAVSVHGKQVEKGLNKQSHIETIFAVLDAIGRSINCTAIVIGGDFNLDINEEIKDQLNGKGFKIPLYKPTIHRVTHAFTRIDYFVYKNYHIDDHVIEVTDAEQKMLKRCPGLVTENDGQFNMDLDDQNLIQVEAISDHDPLFANLKLYRRPSATHSTTLQGTDISLNANSDMQNANDEPEVTKQMEGLDLNGQNGKQSSKMASKDDELKRTLTYEDST